MSLQWNKWRYQGKNYASKGADGKMETGLGGVLRAISHYYCTKIFRL
jgi:hypothetical protein